MWRSSKARQGKAGVEGMVVWSGVLVPLLEIRQSRQGVELEDGIAP
jgi:hypothetical protein